MKVTVSLVVFIPAIFLASIWNASAQGSTALLLIPLDSFQSEDNSPSSQLNAGSLIDLIAGGSGFRGARGLCFKCNECSEDKPCKEKGKVCGHPFPFQGTRCIKGDPNVLCFKCNECSKKRPCPGGKRCMRPFPGMGARCK